MFFCRRKAPNGDFKRTSKANINQSQMAPFLVPTYFWLSHGKAAMMSLWKVSTSFDDCREIVDFQPTCVAFFQHTTTQPWISSSWDCKARLITGTVLCCDSTSIFLSTRTDQRVPRLRLSSMTCCLKTSCL